MVSGVGQPSAYALVVLSEEVRPKQKDPAFRAEAQAQLAALLKHVNSELADYERLQMLVVAPAPWTIENGYLTPTMKIKRNRIESGVESNVEAWYASKGPVHWA
jgi:long-subunit acyl-CoA synthetase (AMP-forming)